MSCPGVTLRGHGRWRADEPCPLICRQSRALACARAASLTRQIRDLRPRRQARVQPRLPCDALAHGLSPASRRPRGHRPACPTSRSGRRRCRLVSMRHSWSDPPQAGILAPHPAGNHCPAGIAKRACLPEPAAPAQLLLPVPVPAPRRVRLAPDRRRNRVTPANERNLPGPAVQALQRLATSARPGISAAGWRS